MLWHLFSQIKKVSRPNESSKTDRKEPISLKKLGKGDGAWSTKKTVLGWNLDNDTQLLRLPPNRQAKVKADLDATPKISHTT